VASVSTGKPGHETPTGVFTTKLKDKDHHSSIYNNAAMPYTQRITNDGVALHAGGVPGYPESHGCVHLPSEYARLLFDAAPLGMTVVIADHRTQPEFVAHPAFLSPLTEKGELAANARLFADQPYRWEPEKSSVGVASMVVSRYDGRIVVLRNGVEIGRAKVQFREPEKPVGTHVFVAHDAVDTQFRWTKVGMIGHMDDANTLPDSDVVNRIILPQDFQQRLTPLLVSGTTMMVTDAPILEHTTGQTMAVLSSHPGI
jgi:L,D-transpeptidase catalytic domain